MAGARYKKLHEFTDVLYGMDSPVVVEKMIHNYDSLHGVNVLQVSFRNVSQNKIYGLSIGLDLIDNRGKKIKSIDFNYYAIEVPHGKTFGASEDIVVEPEAVKFELCVKGADFESGKGFHDKVSLDRVPNPVPLNFYLGQYEEIYTERFAKEFPKAKLVCAPEKRPEFWRCTCTKIWPHEVDKCYFCKVKKDDLFGLLPKIKKEEKEKADAERDAAEERALEAAEKARLIEEAHKKAEEQRRKEEERKKQEEELARMAAENEARALEAQKKKRRTAIAAVASIITVICLFAFYVIPSVQSYHQRRNDQGQTSGGAITEQDDKGKEDDKQGGSNIKRVELNSPFVAMGDGVGEDNIETMWRLLGSSEQVAKKFDRMSVTTNEGHMYLDGVIGRDNVENIAVSGILVHPNSNDGLRIKLYNINYYTEDDFREQILSMGIDNADVVVAAPTGSSGSTAMLGLLKLAGQTTSKDGDPIGKAVSKTSMNIRIGNSTSFKRLTTIPRGSEVNVVEILENSWYKILWPDAEEGFAFTCNENGQYYDFSFLE